MTTPQVQVAGLFGAMVVVFVTGSRLKASGKPYGALLLNIHKLVDLAAVITLGVMVYQAGGRAGFSAGAWFGIGVAIVLTVAMFASGGMVSAMDEAPRWALLTHRLTPWVALGVAMLAVLLVLTGIIAEPETVIEAIIRGSR